ncbi:MAG: ribulose-phosphate 3-epimerase [Clostridiales Family XIII bacterium]|jgi:ribulose-phosphate 3-epimerase|nr:ribulose-phosphate 3-epimerase [Clostridiales Family XIII bacterium]
MAILSPSILTADFSDLSDTLAMFEDSAAVGLLHLDVMDGNFVPNISFGPPVIRSLSAKTSLPFDIHLMVSEPDRFVEDYVTDHTKYIVVHQEANLHLDRTLQHIRSLGVGCGVALNPATAPESLRYVLEKADQVLVMSVNPGFGGQRFLPSALSKIRWLLEERARGGYGYKIAVDGGVNEENIVQICRAGADIIVMGSAILNRPDPRAALAGFAGLIAENGEGGAAQ